jgi:hypothetical protein
MAVHVPTVSCSCTVATLSTGARVLGGSEIDALHAPMGTASATVASPPQDAVESRCDVFRLPIMSKILLCALRAVRPRNTRGA